MTAGARHRDESDLVLLELIRLTSGTTWQPHPAARALLAKRHSRGALRLAHARVQRARAVGTSYIADRSAATLRIALAGDDDDREGIGADVRDAGALRPSGPVR